MEVPLRNICAHHGRLWNLNMICNPSFKGTSLDLKHAGIIKAIIH